MKTIGLIGGMSWESSREYYRIINQTVREKTRRPSLLRGRQAWLKIINEYFSEWTQYCKYESRISE